MDNLQIPLVSIGMPVRNGAAKLQKILPSLLYQTHQKIELCISDNASSDNTQAICEEWAARDNRIRYVRQTCDLGVLQNFWFVLQQATGPYFMWAADDDVRSPEFIAANLVILQTQPEVVCSVSQVGFVGRDGKPILRKGGTESLLDDPVSNLMRFLRSPGANSRFYGLFRTNVIRDSFYESDTFWAADWTIMARTLLHGKHFEVPQRLLWRASGGLSSNPMQTLRMLNRTWVQRRMPMLPMTRALWETPGFPHSFATACRLLRLNVKYFRYLFHMGGIHELRRSMVDPLLKGLGWGRGQLSMQTPKQ